MAFFQNGELVYQVTSTATSGGTTTLTATSTQVQNFTGSSTQTIKLPPTTSMSVGQSYQIYNSSTGSLTIQYQDGTSFLLEPTVAASSSLVATLVSTGTTNGTWTVQTGGASSNAITNTYGPVNSTAGQTTITLPFSVPTLSQSSFFLSVDGKVFSQGASADYTFTNQTTIALNQTLPAGLNIMAWFFGTIATNTVVTTAAPNNKNYVTYSNFENNSITGWSLSHSTLTGVIPTQASGSWTAASGTLSITSVSSGAIGGTYSMQMTSSGATTAGDMLVSQAYTIDTEDQAKVLGFKFFYKISAGAANANFSGTSSNTWAVWIYDVTNSAWIQPTGVYNLIQNSGVGIAQGTFQTPSNLTQFRFALININASSGAVTLLMDDFFTGPQPVMNAPAANDWASFAPIITGSGGGTVTYGTTSFNSAFWRRAGDSVEIMYNVLQTSAGSGGSGNYLFALPPGLIADVTKLAVNTTGLSSVGAGGSGWGSSAPGQLPSIWTLPFLYDSQHLAFQVESTYGTQIILPTADVTGNTNFNLTFTAKIPIVGWSSNSVMSQDTDTRVVAASITGTPPGTSAGSIVICPTVTYDTHSGYNASTGRYTVPVSGFYRVHGHANMTNANVPLDIYVNGSSQGRAGDSNSSGGGAFTGTVKVNAGDLIDIRPNVTAGSATGTNTAWQLYFERLSGPAVVAATETVAASYQNLNAGSNTANNAYNYSTKVFDTHNAVTTGSGNTWRFTAPVAGKYRVSASAYNPNTSQNSLQIYKNGSAIAQAYTPTAGSANMNATVTCQLNAGDTLYAAPSATHNLQGTVTDVISIERIGN